MMPFEEEQNAMPKIPIKKTAIILGAILLILMIGFSFYLNVKSYFDKRMNDVYQQGRTDVLNQIVQQLQQTGRVMLTSPQGSIILVPMPTQ